jgi:glyoxylate/hydroxypyruvate reductase A
VGAHPALLDQLARVKAIFLMGAGVDAILKFGDALPDVPMIRLGDAGMGVQMAEYVAYAVLRYFRRFDEYEQQARRACGIAAAARQGSVHGRRAGPGQAGHARGAGAAPVRLSGARLEPHAKDMPGVECYAGMESLDDFLRGTQVLVCMLPLTPETQPAGPRAAVASCRRAPT